MLADPDWRTKHCADFACEAVKGRTGRDIWAELGGCPRSPREAAAIYRKLGVNCLGDLVSQLLPEVPPLQAMRGDIVMADGALGVCRGEWAEFMDGMQPMARATRAWKVKD